MGYPKENLGLITSRAFKEICYDIAIKFEYEKGAQVTQKSFLGHPPKGIINIRFNNSDLTQRQKSQVHNRDGQWWLQTFIFYVVETYLYWHLLVLPTWSCRIYISLWPKNDMGLCIIPNDANSNVFFLQSRDTRVHGICTRYSSSHLMMAYQLEMSVCLSFSRPRAVSSHDNHIKIHKPSCDTLLAKTNPLDERFANRHKNST